MPRQATIKLQEQIAGIGEALGFDTHLEEQIPGPWIHKPIYDVVWYLPDYIVDAVALDALNKIAPGLDLTRRHFPFAVFEIEGTDPTSKSQIGNLLNLYGVSAGFRFLITNTGGGAAQERCMSP